MRTTSCGKNLEVTRLKELAKNFSPKSSSLLEVAKKTSGVLQDLNLISDQTWCNQGFEILHNTMDCDEVIIIKEKKSKKKPVAKASKVPILPKKATKPVKVKKEVEKPAAKPKTTRKYTKRQVLPAPSKSTAPLTIKKLPAMKKMTARSVLSAGPLPSPLRLEEIAWARDFYPQNQTMRFPFRAPAIPGPCGPNLRHLLSGHNSVPCHYPHMHFPQKMILQQPPLPFLQHAARIPPPHEYFSHSILRRKPANLPTGCINGCFRPPATYSKMFEEDAAYSYELEKFLGMSCQSKPELPAKGPDLWQGNELKEILNKYDLGEFSHLNYSTPSFHDVLSRGKYYAPSTCSSISFNPFCSSPTDGVDKVLGHLLI